MEKNLYICSFYYWNKESNIQNFILKTSWNILKHQNFILKTSWNILKHPENIPKHPETSPWNFILALNLKKLESCDFMHLPVLWKNILKTSWNFLKIPLKCGLPVQTLFEMWFSQISLLRLKGENSRFVFKEITYHLVSVLIVFPWYFLKNETTSWNL